MLKATLQMLAFAAALVAAPAHALDLTGIACDGHGTVMTSQPGYINCAGAFDGNHNNQDVSQILIDNGLEHLVFWGDGDYYDPIHLNDIEPVRKDGPYWRKGDLFLSLRSPSIVMLLHSS